MWLADPVVDQRCQQRVLRTVCTASAIAEITRLGKMEYSTVRAIKESSPTLASRSEKVIRK
jgi:hypothetical protein